MDASKPPLGPSIAGALIAFGSVVFAIPAALAADVSPDGGLFVMINKGGASMYLALMAAMAMAVMQALFIGIAGRASPRLAAFVPPLGVVVLAVGVMGFKLGMGGALRAVEFVAPVDKVTITFAAMSEAMCCLIFGGMLAAALWLGQAAGLAVASAGRPALLFPAAVALACGLWAFGFAMQTGAEAGAFEAVAHVSAADKEPLLAGVLPAVERWGMLRLVLAGIGAVAVAGAAGWGALRDKKGVAFATLGACFIAVSLLGLHVSKHQTDSDVERSVQVSHEPGPDALVFDGPPTMMNWAAELDAKGLHVDKGRTLAELMKELRPLLDDAPPPDPDDPVAHAPRTALLPVQVKKDATAEGLSALAHAAAKAGFTELALIGRRPPGPAHAWPPSLRVLDSATPRETAVALELIGDATQTAHIGDGAVALGDETLPFVPWEDSIHDPQENAAVELAGVSPERLARAIVTLQHAGYRAVAR